jgi:hypothetical protein
MSLIPYTMHSPGKWGVNTQEANQQLVPFWATVADSLVLTNSRQLGCRGNVSILTTVPASAELLRIFDYVDTAGAEIVLTTTATKILKGTTDLTAGGANITSATAPTNGYWRFQNFNGKVVGWQASHTPIRSTGAQFTDIVAASGSIPTGDAMVAAFGRIWAVDSDGQTIKYCALLDETKWATADGAGSIDMRNVWTKGMDRVTALAAFGSNLIVFGRNHIIFYTDGQGSALGMDPTQMFVVDTIEGTGCVSRDTVASIGEGDIVFLASVGVQSLGRILAQKDNALTSVSWQIADRLSTAINTELVSATDLRTWTGSHDLATGQYKLVHRTTGDVYVFHFKNRTQDDKGRDVIPITIWDTAILSNIRQFVTMRTGVQYVIGGDFNHINTYDPTGTLDNALSPIATTWESGWVDYSNPDIESLTKVLKMAQVAVANPSGITSQTTFKHCTDYASTFSTEASSSAAVLVRSVYDPMGDTEGKVQKYGLVEVSGGGRSIQDVLVHMKIGRIAFDHDIDGQAVVAGVTPNANLQLLVAVASNGSSANCVATSMDGTTWTIRTAINQVWRGVCWSKSLKLVVAVASNAIMTSPDGINWTSRTSPGAGGWWDVCWSEDLQKFIAVGSGLTTQRAMTSTDGITWTLVTTPVSCDKVWVSVKWSSRLRAFVAAASGGTNGIMTSPDGVTWTQRSVSLAVGELAESPDMFIAIDENTFTSCSYSSDGVNWVPDSSISAFNGAALCATYSPSLGLFAAGSGATNDISTAPTKSTKPIPLTWTNRTTLASMVSCCWSTYLGKFFFVGAGGVNGGKYSSNGTSWTSFDTPAGQTWAAVTETETV